MLPSFPITLGTLFELILTKIPSSIFPSPLDFKLKSIPLLLIAQIFKTTMSPRFKTSSKASLLTNLGTSINDKNPLSEAPISITQPLKVIFSTLPITIFPLRG